MAAGAGSKVWLGAIVESNWAYAGLANIHKTSSKYLLCIDFDGITWDGLRCTFNILIM